MASSNRPLHPCRVPRVSEESSPAPAAPLGRRTIAGALALALLLTLFFIALLFPWESLGRRITHELEQASGSRITIAEIGPAWTARGPVLRARDVRIAHPAFTRVAVGALEIAPRLSRSWLAGTPALRIWADSELGRVDGVAELGPDSAFVGRVSAVPIEKLPLRLDASGIGLSGELSAEADVGLDPSGVLRGRVDFTTRALVVQSDALPLAIPFTRAAGGIEILEDGSTRIDAVTLEGELLAGEISGTIGLAHRSVAPPVELRADLQIVAPALRQLAPGAGLRLDRNGRASVRVHGPLDQPVIEPLAGAARR